MGCDMLKYFVAGGVAGMLSVLWAFEGTIMDYSKEQHYTYDQQRMDKLSCEENLPRNKRCVLSTLWLPEAEDMPNEHILQ